MKIDNDEILEIIKKYLQNTIFHGNILLAVRGSKIYRIQLDQSILTEDANILIIK